jgi:hypothetical protein
MLVLTLTPTRYYFMIKTQPMIIHVTFNNNFMCFIIFLNLTTIGVLFHENVNDIDFFDTKVPHCY